MIRTWFYTFLQTKEQQQNRVPSDPQEIEIRPLCPWIILKTLTNDDIRGTFQLPMEQGQIREYLLRGVSEHNIAQMGVNVCNINVLVKDVDTNSLHDVKLWKNPQEDCFAMNESWIEEFVNRRRLVEGMVVCMYWDVVASLLCFYVRN